MTSIIFIRFADISGSRANKLFLLTQCIKLIAWRFGELFVRNVIILQRHFAMLDFETYDHNENGKRKKIFNIFLEIFGKIITNYRKFLDSQPYMAVQTLYLLTYLLTYQ